MKTLHGTEDATLFIQGGTGGIGAGLVTYALANFSWKKVFVSYSNLDRLAELESLVDSERGICELIHLDMESDQNIEEAASKVLNTSGYLDVLINAGGFLHDSHTVPEKKLDDISRSNLLKSFNINAVGPLLMARHFYRLFDRDRKSIIVNISAKVGSISDNYLGGWYSYRAAKAALNMSTVNTSIELRRKLPKHICIALHPGTTDTRLSKPFQRRVPSRQLSTPEQTAERLWEVIAKLDYNDSGKFFSWDGSEITW